MENSKGSRAALRRAINRYRDAAIDDAFKGAAHPDDRDEIEERLAKREAALCKLLMRYLP